MLCYIWTLTIYIFYNDSQNRPLGRVQKDTENYGTQCRFRLYARSPATKHAVEFRPRITTIIPGQRANLFVYRVNACASERVSVGRRPQGGFEREAPTKVRFTS